MRRRTGEQEERSSSGLRPRRRPLRSRWSRLSGRQRQRPQLRLSPSCEPLPICCTLHLFSGCAAGHMCVLPLSVCTQLYASSKCCQGCHQACFACSTMACLLQTPGHTACIDLPLSVSELCLWPEQGAQCQRKDGAPQPEPHASMLCAAGLERADSEHAAAAAP